MKQVGLWAARHIINHQIIAYVFEEGQPHERQLNRLLETLTDKDKWYFRMSSLNYAKKKGDGSINALQAADMVSYEAMKEIERKVNPFSERKARMSGKNLAEDRSRNQFLYCEYFAFLGAIRDQEVRSKEYAARAS